MNKEALDIMIDGKKEKRMYMAETSFGLFFTYYFLESIQYPYAKFHIDWFKCLDNIEDTKELHLIAFRESAKSSIIQAFIVWCILFKKRKYIIVDSYSKENAERSLFNVILTFQTNKKIESDFGKFYTVKRDVNEISKKTISNFITDNGIRVEACSTQESLRGRLHQTNDGEKCRPDMWVRDDIETSATKSSKAMTEKIIEHLKESTGGLDSNAWTITLGNYITEYGVIQDIINTRKNVFLQSILNDDGTPSWKSKYALTDEEAQKTGKVSIDGLKRRIADSVAFSAEYLNQPVDEEDALFKKEYFKYVSWDVVKGTNTNTYIAIDTAVSTKESADFTGISIGHVNVNNTVYLEAYKVKMSPKELISEIFNVYNRLSICGKKPVQIGIEETVFYQAIHPYLQDEMRLRNQFLPVTGISHGGKKKEDRILQNLLYRYQNGAIVHIDNKCQELEEELIRFPNSKNDDLSDSTAYLMSIIRPAQDKAVSNTPNPFRYTEETVEKEDNRPLWRQ